MCSPPAAPTPPSPRRSSTTPKPASPRSSNICACTAYPYGYEFFFVCFVPLPFGRFAYFVVSSPMLIPSIDLQGGAVVQLVQGEQLAIRDDDVFRWVRR